VPIQAPLQADPIFEEGAAHGERDLLLTAPEQPS
jgi:hypothetical protein